PVSSMARAKQAKRRTADVERVRMSDVPSVDRHSPPALLARVLDIEYRARSPGRRAAGPTMAAILTWQPRNGQCLRRGERCVFVALEPARARAIRVSLIPSGIPFETRCSRQRSASLGSETID